MDKPAPVRHPVHPFVIQRWSPRALSSEPLPEGLLQSLFEAASWAPSCFNEQPWSWIVADRTEPEAFAAVLGCLVEMNQQWAGHAPVLALGLARTHFTRSGKPNPHAAHDLGQAAAWLTVEATSRGLFVRQMAGILPDKAREVFAIPEGWNAMTAMAIGYPGAPEQLPEAMQAGELAPRSRRPLAESVYTGAFGKSRAGF